MSKILFLQTVFLSVFTMSFSFSSHSAELTAKDKYTLMKNIEANVDFAHVTGDLNFKNHTFGIGGVNSMPYRFTNSATIFNPLCELSTTGLPPVRSE